VRVSCFTFLRNCQRLGYPFCESIRSALPVCDEYIVVVGDCDDDTRERVLAIGDPRFRIIDTVWDPKVRNAGYVLAQQKMIAQFNCTGDWAFYVEADEVVQDGDIERIRDAMQRHLADERVEALYLDFVHFAGSAEWVTTSHHGYRREVRVFRNALRWFTSDALYYLVMDGKKQGRYPCAARANATILHYGHARAARFVTQKSAEFGPFYAASACSTAEPEEINPGRDLRLLRRFDRAHPAVMKDWLAACAERNFAPERMPVSSVRHLRYLIALKLERWFGLDFSKRHFVELKV
jgi:glycosyltransferase involved in cell wall biosynthesis